MSEELKNKIADYIDGKSNMTFADIALSVYNFQSQNNPVYARYLSLMGYTDRKYHYTDDIPLMPISFFKHYDIKSGAWDSDMIFLSSGTSGMQRSRHLVKDANWYNQISFKIFRSFFSRDYETLALLPSYMENGNSSLVHMVTHLSGDADPHRFHLYDHHTLNDQIINKLNRYPEKDTILWGVTFALMDFIEEYSIDNKRLKIIFTGGMKSRGEELAFDTVFAKLSSAFPSSLIASEYGMTELFSQAYAFNNKYFIPSATMQVLTKDFNDLTCPAATGKTGQIGIIDLANVDTLSFIQTDDIGLCHDDNRFELMGRVTNSDLRGCNMLYDGIK
jgi:hypothetical protein